MFLGAVEDQGHLLLMTSLLSRAWCRVGIVSSCVSWLSRIPTGSGGAVMMVPEANGPRFPGVEWKRGRVSNLEPTG